MSFSSVSHYIDQIKPRGVLLCEGHWAGSPKPIGTRGAFPARHCLFAEQLRESGEAGQGWGEITRNLGGWTWGG